MGIVAFQRIQRQSAVWLCKWTQHGQPIALQFVPGQRAQLLGAHPTQRPGRLSKSTAAVISCLLPISYHFSHRHPVSARTFEPSRASHALSLTLLQCKLSSLDSRHGHEIHPSSGCYEERGSPADSLTGLYTLTRTLLVTCIRLFLSHPHTRRLRDRKPSSVRIVQYGPGLRYMAPLSHTCCFCRGMQTVVDGNGLGYVLSHLFACFLPFCVLDSSTRLLIILSIIYLPFFLLRLVEVRP